MTAPAAGPREVLERLHRGMTATTDADHLDDELWAEDVVVETPFAPPGRPRRFVGREQFLTFARAGRAALPVRLEVGKVVVYETTDPDMIITEYELSGTDPATGQRASAPFIGVLKVRDGQIAHWREYQDMLAMAAATGQLPDLLAGLQSAAAAEPV
ncbi:nuclear transport factor 2 family protein [Streptosporangium roseum]|uniref:nuclear transport factor 2 family protein n=1 Tax=Streptosporangium roseum TaxID=2001 RepID=UPI00332E165A